MEVSSFVPSPIPDCAHLPLHTNQLLPLSLQWRMVSGELSILLPTSTPKLLVLVLPICTLYIGVLSVVDIGLALLLATPLLDCSLSLIGLCNLVLQSFNPCKSYSWSWKPIIHVNEQPFQSTRVKLRGKNSNLM